MTKSKTLILGYGLNPMRTEAIAKSAIKLQSVHKQIGLACDIISIDQLAGTESLVGCVAKRWQITDILSRVISNNQYTHIVDVFALPLSSYIFTKPILTKFPGLVFIKEMQNDYGSSRHITSETLIRIIGNNKKIFDYILQTANICFSRNLSLCNKYKLLYLPTAVESLALNRAQQSKNLRVCYLGHPLRKKGIYVFPDIFKLIESQEDRAVDFSFAFSEIGPKDAVVKEFKAAANKANINVKILGKVDPAEYFRENDIYLLPIHDQFGAASTPNTILEAMEAGCVVMTTPIESVAGVLNSGNSILLKRMDASTILKAIMHYNRNRKMLKEKSNRAKRLITKEYSINKYIQQLRKLYDTKK